MFSSLFFLIFLLFLIPTCDSDWVRKYNKTISRTQHGLPQCFCIGFPESTVNVQTCKQTNIFSSKRFQVGCDNMFHHLFLRFSVSSTFSTSCMGLQSAHLLYVQVIRSCFLCHFAWSLQNWQFGNVMQCGMVDIGTCRQFDACRFS